MVGCVVVVVIVIVTAPVRFVVVGGEVVVLVMVRWWWVDGLVGCWSATAGVAVAVSVATARFVYLVCWHSLVRWPHMCAYVGVDTHIRLRERARLCE